MTDDGKGTVKTDFRKSRITAGLPVVGRRSSVVRSRGMSLVELLVAAFIIAIAAGWALAAWNITSRAPAQKRVTEMGAFIGMQEVERIKSQRYMSLTAGTTGTTYFDKYGAPTTVVADRAYRADTSITAAVNRDGPNNSEDLLEIVVVVRRPDGTGAPFETARTLLTFGGM